MSELFNKLILNKGFEDELTRTNMKKLKIELPLILGMWPFISYIVGQAADKDKKNKQLELDREELLQLIKKIVTTK